MAAYVASGWLCVSLGFLVIIPGVHGYPAGAPDKACESMTPGHDYSPQAPFTIPFTLELSQLMVNAGDSVSMKLKAPSGRSFKGFFIQARVPATGEAVGTWETSATTRTACNNRAITHDGNHERSLQSLLWQAPSDVSKVVFVWTIVEQKERFWVKVTSNEVEVSRSVPTVPTQPTTTTTIRAITASTTTTTTTATTTAKKQATSGESGHYCRGYTYVLGVTLLIVILQIDTVKNSVK